MDDNNKLPSKNAETEWNKVEMVSFKEESKEPLEASADSSPSAFANECVYRCQKCSMEAPVGPA
jgi:hypothetical protein